MVTEKDRIIAAIMAIADGPTPEQIVEGGWTPEMLAFNRRVLIALVRSIQSGHYLMLDDETVKQILAQGIR